MIWDTPEYSDIRFGFEVTMYINNIRFGFEVTMYINNK